MKGTAVNRTLGVGMHERGSWNETGVGRQQPRPLCRPISPPSLSALAPANSWYWYLRRRVPTIRTTEPNYDHRSKATRLPWVIVQLARNLAVRARYVEILRSVHFKATTTKNIDHSYYVKLNWFCKSMTSAVSKLAGAVSKHSMTNIILSGERHE